MKKLVCLLLLLALTALSTCASNQPEDSQTMADTTPSSSQFLETTAPETSLAATTPPPTTPVPTTTEPPTKLLIVIDPGHQARGNYDREPIGPGASETKAKVSSGTQGCVTGLAEYELNLMVSLKLKEVLEGRGYAVILTRDSHNVDLSNSQRAQIANEAGADAFVRIHANGSEDSSASGAMTICQTPENPYNGDLYPRSHELSQCVLDGLVASTGCKREFVWETDTMSGVNWCAVPATIVEMGYMSNPQEDRMLSQEDYQWKIANGIADGIDAFFAVTMPSH